MIVGLSLNFGWIAALVPSMVLGLLLLALLVRRGQMRQYAASHQQLVQAKERGSHQARLQHPDIDLSKCIGCGSCVRACPEDGVLDLLHGQAVVVHGARCVGHGACAAACPTGAIALTLGDLSTRQDLPALSEELGAVGVPGLFLAGELTGFALVRTAVGQGVAVADVVAHRIASAKKTPAGVAVLAGAGEEHAAEPEVLDLLVVGAGPGGLACSLRAKELGLSFVTIEQEHRLGGTVAAYPRKKMVMTQPVELPLHGRLPKLTYQKEELIDLWNRVARENDLPIHLGVRLVDLARTEEGTFAVTTSGGVFHARNVCLALGRRGSPRKLGVPGEELQKVSYSLIDAESYSNQRILIVGGGDSAVEAALGLAEQQGNTVTLSYRRNAFTRLKARNETRIQRAIAEERVLVLLESEVISIEPDKVRIRFAGGREQDVVNDAVFIFAGGDPPFALLERAGVSFDPKDRPAPAEIARRSTALLRAISLAFFFAIVLTAWGIWFKGYYALETHLRSVSSLHPLLRPGGPIGLAAGLVACGLFLWNLMYLVKRSTRMGKRIPGTLRTWLGSHVFTGIMALLCVLAHAGFSARPTVGGHALAALLVVVATGLIGRYLYAFIPHAANGTESGLDDLRGQLASVSAEWDRDGRGFGTRVRENIEDLIAVGRWHPGLMARLGALIRGQWQLRRSLHRLRHRGLREGIPDREVRHVLMLARRAYNLTLLVAHYEEIRAVLSSWRYFHRWLGVLLVLLAIVHIITAVKYADIRLNEMVFFWEKAP